MRHRPSNSRPRTSAARVESASLVDIALAAVIATLLSWLIVAS